MYELTFITATTAINLGKFNDFSAAAEHLAYLIKYAKTHIDSIHMPLVGAWDYYTPIGTFEIATCKAP